VQSCAVPELPDGEDAAAAGGGGADAEERAVGEASAGGGRDEHVGAHLPQDLGTQRQEAAVLDGDPGAHRHLPSIRISASAEAMCRVGDELCVVRRRLAWLGTASARPRSSPCLYIALGLGDGEAEAGEVLHLAPSLGCSLVHVNAINFYLW